MSVKSINDMPKFSIGNISREPLTKKLMEPTKAAKIAKYREMSYYPEIANALDMITDEAVVPEKSEKVFLRECVEKNFPAEAMPVLEPYIFEEPVNHVYNEIELTNAGNVLAFSCVHLPFEKKGYLEFIQRMRDYYKCETVICLGDLIDSHAISMHDHSPDGMGAGHEIEAVAKKISKWVDVFPDLYLTYGNHDKLPFRQAYSNGLPKSVIRDLNDIYSMPEEWKWCDRVLADDVVYQHGTGKSGENAAKQWMMDNRRSTVIGHIHSSLGVNFSASNYDRLFSMCVGCGIDIKQYAFEYNKDFGKRPILGCGVILDNGKQPIACPYYM